MEKIYLFLVKKQERDKLITFLVPRVRTSRRSTSNIKRSPEERIFRRTLRSIKSLERAITRSRVSKRKKNRSKRNRRR